MKDYQVVLLVEGKGFNEAEQNSCVKLELSDDNGTVLDTYVKTEIYDYLVHPEYPLECPF